MNRVVVSVFFRLFSQGIRRIAVFCDLFCDIAVFAIFFFAVLRCSEPPNVPLLLFVKFRVEKKGGQNHLKLLKL